MDKDSLNSLCSPIMNAYCGFVVCTSLAASFVVARAETNPSTSSAGPKIQFAQPVFDFGRVKAGEVVKHAFVFTNTGSANLEILDVKPGCGCTAAGTWDKLVEPGKTGSIPLQLNSTGFGGKITKSANIFCNDPAQSNVVLQITGTVWKPLELTPASAMFNLRSEDQTNETRILRIVSNLEEPVTLSDPVCSNAFFRAELKVVRPGKEFELLVTALTPITNATLHAPIAIKTSSREQPEINTYAYATVLPAISVMPESIVLAGAVVANSPHNVTIRNSSTNNLALYSPSINAPGGTVALRDLQ